nr:hypothetical protein [Eubacterium sp.]
MKKILLVLTFIMLATLNVHEAQASTDSVIRGNYEFEYEPTKGGVWITKVTPLSDKGIATLIIPAKIEGKKVVKLGGPKDTMDTSWEDDDSNLFGMKWSEDYADLIVPEKVHDRVAKIKTIQIPSTVTKITMNCFNLIPDGKTINIPKGVTRNVEWLIDTKWKKMTISPKNRTYKIVRGCLLTKDGTKMYGFVQKRKKVVIPNTVKEMLTVGGDYNGVFEIVIPKSVKKIENEEMCISVDTKIKVAKGNKNYASKKGCLYNKKKKCVVAVAVLNGVFRIPQGVVYFSAHPRFIGPQAEKLIVPSSVEKMEFLMNLSVGSEFTCVMEGITPPKLDYTGVYNVKNLTVYVPKGCTSIYEQAWKFDSSITVTYIEQE